MQIIWCLGGLGNQMFQYAFYRSLQLSGKEARLYIGEFDSYSLHNGFELKNIFNLNPKTIGADSNFVNFKSNKLLKIFKNILKNLRIYSYEINQDEFNFNEKYQSYKLTHYLTGYWQSEKYFKGFEKQIRGDFIFPPLDDSNKLLADKIASSNSVSLHIRMGDYVNHPIHGGICTLEYYKKAIEIIRNNVADPEFFIFSNDIDWCRNNLLLESATYITGNEGANSYKDMHLMSLCKHNIIANSSFSWWGSWLNNNQNKIVVAPKKWFNDLTINTRDLLPEKWIKI